MESEDGAMKSSTYRTVTNTKSSTYESATVSINGRQVGMSIAQDLARPLNRKERRAEAAKRRKRRAARG